MTPDADPYGKILDEEEPYSIVTDDASEWIKNWRDWSISKELDTETHEIAEGYDDL